MTHLYEVKNILIIHYSTCHHQKAYLTLLIVCLCIYFWGLAAKVRICQPFGLYVFF